MSVRSVVRGMAVAVLCLAGPAMAQVEADEVQEKVGFDPAATRVGVDVRVGVGGMTGELGELTAPGPLLGITAAAQPSEALGIEVGYEGQRLPIDDFRVGDEQAMYRHNITLLAKTGPLLMEDKLRPYVGAGVGVSYLNVTDGAQDTGLYTNDMVRELPVAAGLDYRITDNIHAGARASYRFMFGEEFANDAQLDNEAEGDLLNVGLTVGGRF
jgi:Outer membrane protein beta-barrel domain